MLVASGLYVSVVRHGGSLGSRQMHRQHLLQADTKKMKLISQSKSTAQILQPTGTGVHVPSTVVDDVKIAVDRYR